MIGGGVAGLAAAWEILDRTGGDAEVTVLEATDRVGGKLRAEELAGVSLDVGAEAMLNRRPEGVGLARAAGLEVVHPAGAQSHLWVGGEVKPLPRTLMGVPLDVPALAASGVLSPDAMRRVEREPMLPPMHIQGDLSVGDLISARFGDEVTDVLVEPLLGGVYAGHAREISARSAAPQLLALASQGSMLEAAAGLGATAQPSPAQPSPAQPSPAQPDQTAAPVPVFASVAGGMHRLPVALAARLDVRTDTVVESLHRSEAGFTLTVTHQGETTDCDATHVVVAVPAHIAASLLTEVAPSAAAELTHFEAASVGVISFAYDAEEAIAHSTVAQRGSGFLVPPTERRGIKAATFSFAKWAQIREAGRGAGPGGRDVLFLRASVARLREDEVLRLGDEQIVDVARADLASAVGLELDPLASHVQRWWSGLPQYPVGHQTRVERVRAEVAKVPSLAVAGAAYDGVGIPATIASAQRAARELTPEQGVRGDRAE